MVVGAHYDTKDDPGFVGANDGASGVAVLLELARALPRPARRPVGRSSSSSTPRRRAATGRSTSDGTRGSRQYVAYARDGGRAGLAAARPRSARWSSSTWSATATCRSRARRLRPEPLPAASPTRPRARRRPAPFEGTRLPGRRRPHRRSSRPGSRRVDLIDFDYGPGPPPGRLLAHAGGHARQGLRGQPRAGGRGGAGRDPADPLTAVRGRLPCRRMARRQPPHVRPSACCSPRRAATARASTAPCRRSSRRSTSTGRRSTCARRSSTTSTSSRSSPSAARSSSRRRPRSRRASWSSSPPTASRRACTRTPAAQPAHDRRHLPARHQGPRRGAQVRRAGLHDRPHRPRRATRRSRGRRARRPTNIVLVETVEDVDALELADPDHVAFITQTTLSVDETAEIIARLRERFPNIIAPKSDDICYATTNRQIAVKQLARECELVLVIGSTNSSNSNRLVEVAREHGAASHLIDNAIPGRRGVARGCRDRRDHVRRERARRSSSAPLVDFFRERGRRGRLGAARRSTRTCASCSRSRSATTSPHAPSRSIGRTGRRGGAGTDGGPL